jgi:hypothetical protein
VIKVARRRFDIGAVERWVLLAGIFLLTAGGSAHAEDATIDSALTFHKVQLTLDSGEKIRADELRIAGDRATLYEYRAEEADMLIRPRTTVEIASLEVPKLARIETRAHSAGTGAAVGAFAGAMSGALWMASETEGASYGRVEYIAISAGVFALTGAAVGGLAGFAFRHWETVYDPAAGVTLPQPRQEYAPGVGYRREQSEAP